MIEQDQDMPLEEAPYKVSFAPGIASRDGANIWPWYRENGACGRVRTTLLEDEKGLFIGWTFHFTDADTAFWFKMRFGGSE